MDKIVVPRDRRGVHHEIRILGRLQAKRAHTAQRTANQESLLV